MVFSSLVSALATHPATADPSSGDMFAAAFGGPPTSAPSSVMFNASAAAAAAAGPAVSGSEGFAIDVLPRFLADIARLNPFLLTTIWVGILALVTRTAWRLYYFVYDLIVSRLLTTTLTLTNEDAAFAPLTAYLSRKGAFLSASKSSLKTTWNKSKKKQQERRADALRRALTKAEADLEARLPDIDFEPASGVHVFTFRGKLVWMTRQTATTPITTGWERSPFIFSSITLSAFGRSPDLFKDLIREAISESLERVDDETKVYTLGRQASYWSVAASRTTRNFDSVILPPGMAERVSRDVGEFLASEDWYNSRGIPFRRGILLAGVPGSGKTSLATALAGAHALDICVLTLSNKNLDDTTLAARLQDAPPRSIILLEDVDSVFVQRSAVSNAQAVTFSGLLNAIDGVAAQDGRVLLLSTNHPERLDPALIRPGRVDLHLHFGYAQTSQIRALFRRFYPGATAVEEQAFADLVPAGRLCMAALQGHFLSHKDDPEGAIADAGDLAQHYQGGSDEDNNAEAQAAALMRLGIRSMLRRLGLSQYIPNFVEQGVTSAAELTGLIANDLMGTFRLTTYAHRLRIQGALSSPPVATVVERAALVDADQAREIYDQWAALRASDHGDDEAGLLARRDVYVAALPIGTISGWQVFEHLDRVGDGGVEAAIATAAAAGDDYEKRECEMSAAEKAERDAAAKAAATADGDGEEEAEAEAEAEELDGSGVGN